MIAKVLVVCGVAVFSWLGWHVVNVLSSDAVGLALGLLFGVLATLPATALVMAARERQAQNAGPGYTVRHEHTHSVERAQLEDAYRAGYEAGRSEKGTSLTVVDSGGLQRGQPWKR